MINFHPLYLSEIAPLPASSQFFVFSEAYLYSAKRLCDILAASPGESSFPRGAVVMSLAFHGIELFFKAAILHKYPTEKFKGCLGHDLECLKKRYANLYPKKEFYFKNPFLDEEIDLSNFDPFVAEQYMLYLDDLKQATPKDQLYRYPKDKEGNPWKGVYAFEPISFSDEISMAQQNIARLKELIVHG